MAGEFAKGGLQWKNHRGTYESFVSGYKTNISDTVDSIQVKMNNSTSTGFDYTLIARDVYQGNKVKVQTFKGTVRMVWDKGQWKIGYAESKKVSEYIE